MTVGRNRTFTEWLDRLCRWDRVALDADVKRFHEVYRHVSILPPDQYMALVVQSSEGCPWNRCTFCKLYRDRRFRLKGQDEFAEHAGAILDLLGEGVKLRRSVLLGDANMPWAPAGRLTRVMSTVADLLLPVGGPHKEFYSLTDAGGALCHHVSELAELRDMGLRRLYLGPETGNSALLGQLNKPNSAEEMIRAVKHLHQAGVIVLLGVGGEACADQHERDTVAVLNAMGLGSGGIIYFSPLVEYAEVAYTRHSRQSGFGTMKYAAMRNQQERMAAGLRFCQGWTFISIYYIGDFVY